VIGAGEVIFDSDGKNIVDFSQGLGKNTNNKVKNLAVYMGLQIAHSRSIQALTVIEGSDIVISVSFKPMK
jgi:ribonuclease HI